MGVPIYLERSRTWSFAGSLSWPGWTRHARAPHDPVAELVAVGPRYRDVLTAAGLDFDPPGSVEELEVVETLEGDSGTEWGVPSVPPSIDHGPLDAAEADRQLAILQACWAAFDRTVEAVDGYVLRTGPRGGGRQLPALIEHCLEADKAYLSKLGSRRARIPQDDWRAVEADIRQRAVEALRDRVAGRAVREPSKTRRLWSPRWYVRYVAWHTLVHTWEMEDRRTDARL